MYKVDIFFYEKIYDNLVNSSLGMYYSTSNVIRMTGFISTRSTLARQNVIHINAFYTFCFDIVDLVEIKSSFLVNLVDP